MAKVNAPIFSLNGGEVGEEALSRLDLERLQFAGSLYRNMLPRVVGSMTFRPGFEHIVSLPLGDVLPLEYSYSGGASLLPILSNGQMRVVKDGVLVSRVAVSTTITNDDFDSGLTGWTDISTGGAVADTDASLLRLFGTTQDRAGVRQAVSVSVGDRNKEHGLRVEVNRGPVSLRLGSTADSDNLIREAVLDDGYHSLAFTPTTATVYVELFNDNARASLVQACKIEGAGTMVIPAPWTDDDLVANIIRYEQNKDVLYVASGVYRQRMVQRRGDTSWGVQHYKSDDGPFVASDGMTSLAPSALTGTGSLVASRNYFTQGMTGRLFRLFQSGQTVVESFTSDPADGAFIRVSGVDNDRRFSWEISGTWTGTVRLQVATDDGAGNPGGWSDVWTRTTNGASTYTDSDDNVIKYFRFSVSSGELTSGVINARLSYDGGSQSGVVRVTGYTSPTSVTMEVIKRLYSTTATFEWDYSTWSDHDGWPSAVEAFGGRLYWAQGDMINGSVPDAYKSFDDEVEGDSAPIARSIGAGTDRGILWLLGLQRLIAGTDCAEVSVKSSSFDEPLTSTSWFPIESSTRGGYNLRSVKCDKDGVFVQASGTGVFALSTDQGTLDYGSIDLTAMHEEICGGFPIVDIAVQRRPDTIVWFILANGEARALTYEPAEKVIAWSRIVTSGLIKRVAASRGAGQDNVYFIVNRNGSQRLERLADFKDCRGGTTNCLADGFTRFTTVGTTSVFSVPHLEGQFVTVWAHGVAVHDQDNPYLVEGGQVALSTPVLSGRTVIIGVPYTADFQSTKLAYGAQGGTALFQRKKVSQLGMYLLDTAVGKVKVGKDFNSLHQLAETYNGKPLTPGQVLQAYDADLMSVSSDWLTDSRVCIQAKSPYSFTAATLVLDVNTHG